MHNITDDEITKVDDDIFQCNNCGAYASTAKAIQHFPTCKPGESKRWEGFYNDANEKGLASIVVGSIVTILFFALLTACTSMPRMPDVYTEEGRERVLECQRDHTLCVALCQGDPVRCNNDCNQKLKECYRLCLPFRFVRGSR